MLVADEDDVVELEEVVEVVIAEEELVVMLDCVVLVGDKVLEAEIEEDNELKLVLEVVVEVADEDGFVDK